MNWIEIISLVASIASISAFLLFLYFGLALWLKKRELSKRIVSLEGSPLVLGINEGAEVLKEIYDKFDEIKLGESNYRIMERSITMKSEEFGCTDKILSYRFASPWLALSQENYSRYTSSVLGREKESAEENPGGQPSFRLQRPGLCGKGAHPGCTWVG